MVVALVSDRNGPCRGCLLIYRPLFYSYSDFYVTYWRITLPTYRKLYYSWDRIVKYVPFFLNLFWNFLIRVQHHCRFCSLLYSIVMVDIACNTITVWLVFSWFAWCERGGGSGTDFGVILVIVYKYCTQSDMNVHWPTNSLSFIQ
jgi:hypothetical protein